MMNFIFLFLNEMFLQTGNPLGDLIYSITNPQQPPAAGSVIIAPNWIPMVTFILVAFIVFILYRFFSIQRKKPNNEAYLGVIEFVVRGQGQWEGWVSRYKAPLSDSYIRGLRRKPKYAKFTDELLRLRNDGHLFIYQFHYRRTKELLIHTLRRTRVPSLIISTAELESSDVSIGQSEALWSWTTLSSDHVKTVECHPSSEKFEIEFGTRNELVDVWMMAPLIFKELKTEIKQRPSVMHHEKLKIPEQRFETSFKTLGLCESKIITTILPYSEEFAEACPHIVAAAKQTDYVINMKTQNATLGEQIRERDDLINDLRKDNSSLEGDVANKPLRYAPEKPQRDVRLDIMFMVLLVGGMTLIFSQLPRYIQGLSNTDPLFMGFIGLIIGAALVMIIKSKKEKENKQLSREGTHVSS